MNGKALVMCLLASWKDKFCRIPFISNKNYTQAMIELEIGSRDFKRNYLTTHCKHVECNKPVWAFVWVEMNPLSVVSIINHLKYW